MKGDKIFMSQEQLQRFRVMGLVEAEKITLKDGAGKMGISYRQAKRIWKRVREKGAQGLLHGNCGRSPQNRIPDAVKKRVLALSRQKYHEFNDRHFWEQLLEVEGIALGREMVRIIRAISFHYPAKVGLDNTVRLGDLLLDIPPGPLGRSYAKARVEVRQLLNGSWKVYYQDRLIAKHPSTALQEPIRALHRNRSPAISPGAESHNWIYQASAQPIYDNPFV
jgi:hypothetical protein